mgnify:CR=1 FL=1
MALSTRYFDSQGPLLLHLLSKFCNYFSDALDGQSPDVSVSELYGGARISYIFHDIFSQGSFTCYPLFSMKCNHLRIERVRFGRNQPVRYPFRPGHPNGNS